MSSRGTTTVTMSRNSPTSSLISGNVDFSGSSAGWVMVRGMGWDCYDATRIVKFTVGRNSDAVPECTHEGTDSSENHHCTDIRLFVQYTQRRRLRRYGAARAMCAGH